MIHACKTDVLAAFDLHRLRQEYEDFAGYSTLSFDAYLEQLATNATGAAERILRCPVLPVSQKRTVELRSPVLGSLPLGGYLCDMPSELSRVNADMEEQDLSISNLYRDPLSPDRLRSSLPARFSSGILFTTGIWAVLAWRYPARTITLAGDYLAGSTSLITDGAVVLSQGDVLYDATSGAVLIVSADDGAGGVTLDEWGLGSSDILDGSELANYGALEPTIRRYITLRIYLEAYKRLRSGSAPHPDALESASADKHSFKRIGSTNADSYIQEQAELETQLYTMRPMGAPL